MSDAVTLTIDRRDAALVVGALSRAAAEIRVQAQTAREAQYPAYVVEAQDRDADKLARYSVRLYEQL